MKDLSTLEQPPFLLAIFFASLAWAITWYVGIQEKSPIIAYNISVTKSSGHAKVLATIENLTRDKVFHNLEVIIHAIEITNPSIIDTPPAWHGDKPPKAKGQTALYTIYQLQPGWSFKLIAECKADVKPWLQVKKSKETIRLIETGIETFLIKFQAKLIFGLLFIWGLITSLVYGKRYYIDKPISTNRLSAKKDEN